LFVLFLAVLLTNKDNKKSICPLLAVCLSFERDIRGSFSSGGIAVSGPMADASGRAAEFVGQAACGMKNRHAEREQLLHTAPHSASQIRRLGFFYFFF